jgi:peroxiredoxin
MPRRKTIKKNLKKRQTKPRQWPKGKAFFAVGLVIVVFVAYGIWQYYVQLPPAIGGDTDEPLQTGSAPDFSLGDINGTQLSLSQFEGNVIAIHFMAVGCSGQYNSINDNQLRQLRTVCNTHCGNSPIKLVTVAVSTCSANDLSLIRSKYGINWALGNDYADGILDVIEAYEPFSIEDGTIILVDKAFNVDEVYTETVTSTTLITRIGQLLGA